MMIARMLLPLALAAGFLMPLGCRSDDDNEPNSGTDGGPGSDPGDPGADTSIYDLQDDALADGAAVTLRGVVVVAVDTYGARTGGLYVMEPEGGPYSGVFVFVRGTDAARVAPGDLIDITGGVKDEFALDSDMTGRTLTEVTAPQGGSLTITKVGTAAVPEPAVVDPQALAADDAEAEKWEGVLVKFEKVAVLAAPNGVSDSDATLKEMRVSGPFGIGSALTELSDDIAQGDCYESITGIGDYFFNYKLLPRSPADLVAGSDCLAEEEGEAACTDGEDNDADGFADCADFSCQDTVEACVMATTVADIQRGTIEPNSAVTLTGLVVTALHQDDADRTHLWVADNAQAAPYEGVYVYRRQAEPLAAEIVVGAKVDVTGRITEYRGELTEIVDPMVTLSAAPAMTPTALAVELAALKGTDGESYEGVLVRVENVEVSALSEPLVAGEFTIADGTAELTVGNIIDAHEPSIGDCITITGQMHWRRVGNVSQQVLLPRAGDVQPGTCN